MTEQDELKWREQGRAAFLAGQRFESGPSEEQEPDASFNWAIGFQQAHGELHAELQDDDARDHSTPLRTLSDDVRMLWESNCAGEIFLVSDSEDEGLRIGHFQGDAALAAYIVSMHNAALAAAE